MSVDIWSKCLTSDGRSAEGTLMKAL